MINEIRAEGCHLKSDDIFGITRGIYFTAGPSGRTF